MKRFPTTEEEWFTFISFLIKAFTTGLFLGIWGWYYLNTKLFAGMPLRPPVTQDMRQVLPFVLICYLLASLNLLGMGVVEWRRRRKEQAWSDFAFVVVVLLYWLLQNGLLAVTR